MGEAKTKRRLALGKPDALGPRSSAGLTTVCVLALVVTEPPVSITGSIHGRQLFLVITSLSGCTLCRRIARAGIAFLIAMVGVAAIWAVSTFCSETTTLPMKRKSAASGSWCRTGSSFYSSSELSTSPVFGFTTCAWAHASTHLNIGEVVTVFGGHQPCVLMLWVSIGEAETLHHRRAR